MTAWEILTLRSTAAANSTAWVHLNSQPYGLIINDGISVEVLQMIEVEVLETEVSVEVESGPIVVEVDDDQIYTEVVWP